MVLAWTLSAFIVILRSLLGFLFLFGVIALVAPPGRRLRVVAFLLLVLAVTMVLVYIGGPAREIPCGPDNPLCP